jgi:hypothetical protein
VGGGSIRLHGPGPAGQGGVEILPVPGGLILGGDGRGDRIGDRDGDAADEHAVGIGLGGAGMDAEIADAVERRRADGERGEAAVAGEEFAGPAGEL